jgi:hypothetical protein
MRRINGSYDGSDALDAAAGVKLDAPTDGGSLADRVASSESAYVTVTSRAAPRRARISPTAEQRYEGAGTPIINVDLVRQVARSTRP